MRFVPEGVSRQLASQTLVLKKHSPAILLGAGIVGMVGSTVLACRATLKLEETLNDIQAEKNRATQIKHHVESQEYKAQGGQATYPDEEMAHDMRVIIIQGGAKIVKLYAPAAIVGGLSIFCLTKSHKILVERNVALTAAYVTLDSAFRAYRKRVVNRYGEDTDREMLRDYEEIDLVDEETGKITEAYQVAPGEPTGYARWFDEENANFSSKPGGMPGNWVFLRHKQNWCNDMLHSRGHLFLNEVYGELGLSHTNAGAAVGWLYNRENKDGDNYVDFGCWEQQRGKPVEYTNGRDGGILLDFNVDGPIWHLMDGRIRGM